MTTNSERLTYSVDPSRLESGNWCFQSDKTIGRGDIAGSYSADCIAEDKPIRNPFEFGGAVWICVGLSACDGITTAKAYRLQQLHAFAGTPTTYREKLIDADAARADPLGFYHGMTVRHGSQDLVLCGPPAEFMAGTKQQLDLFG